MYQIESCGSKIIRSNEALVTRSIPPQAMAEAPQVYLKVGRHGDHTVEAFNLWAASAEADYRDREGASLETIRESIIGLAITWYRFAPTRTHAAGALRLTHHPLPPASMTGVTRDYLESELGNRSLGQKLSAARPSGWRSGE